MAEIDVVGIGNALVDVLSHETEDFIRANGLAKVTMSSAFAFAILLRFGVAPAVAVYVVSVVIADTWDRVAPIKVLFNAAQYALAMVAAAAVLAALGPLPLNWFTTAELPAVLAAIPAGYRVLVVDNNTAVHGRTPFTPRFDGTDRWLQRTFVVADLAGSAGDRRGRVITTHFGV